MILSQFIVSQRKHIIHELSTELRSNLCLMFKRYDKENRCFDTRIEYPGKIFINHITGMLYIPQIGTRMLFNFDTSVVCRENRGQSFRAL